jgi:hypothetical protein
MSSGFRGPTRSCPGFYFVYFPYLRNAEGRLCTPEQPVCTVTGVALYRRLGAQKSPSWHVLGLKTRKHGWPMLLIIYAGRSGRWPGGESPGPSLHGVTRARAGRRPGHPGSPGLPPLAASRTQGVYFGERSSFLLKGPENRDYQHASDDSTVDSHWLRPGPAAVTAGWRNQLAALLEMASASESEQRAPQLELEVQRNVKAVTVTRVKP